MTKRKSIVTVTFIISAKEAAKIKRAATLAAKNISKDTPTEKNKILASQKHSY